VHVRQHAASIVRATRHPEVRRAAAHQLIPTCSANSQFLSSPLPHADPRSEVTTDPGAESVTLQLQTSSKLRRFRASRKSCTEPRLA